MLGYPGKALEDTGAMLMALGTCGLIGSLCAVFEVGMLTSVFLIFIIATVLMLLVGIVLSDIGYKKHIGWCRQKGYISDN